MKRLWCSECCDWRTVDVSPIVDMTCVSRGLCYECDFWRQLVILADDPSMVRVRGEHYHMASKTEECLRGFGGVTFKIRFFDGRIVETNNLWFQGLIPNRFRDRLPDNAEFYA